jgi:predicted nucleotidyltransferase
MVKEMIKPYTQTIAEKFISPNSINHKAIQEFLLRLREEEGDNLLQVHLFGSVARGDDNEGSDIDVFILLKDYDKTGTEKVAIIERILNMASAVEEMNDHQVYISPLIRSEETYLQNRRRSLIYYNIADEGVLLYAKDA